MNDDIRDSLLHLKNDYVFRKVFGDERNIDALSAFIRSTGCLDDDELENLRIVDPHLLSDDPDGKDSTLDVFAVTGRGESIHIEIQLLNLRFFKERIVYYMSKILSGKLRSGEGYGGIGRVITIVIVNWNMSDTDGRYHKVYSMREAESGEEFSDVLELHTLELPRVSAAVDDDELCNWLRMIRSERRDEMEMLASKSPELKKVYSRVVELSADDAERMRADMREKWRRDWAERMSASREEGLAEGMAKGMKIGEAKGIISMAREFGMSDSDIIARITLSLPYDRDEAERILRDYDE